MPFSQFYPQSQSLQAATIWLAMMSSKPTRLHRTFQHVYHLCERLKPSSVFSGHLGSPLLPDPTHSCCFPSSGSTPASRTDSGSLSFLLSLPSSLKALPLFSYLPLCLMNATGFSVMSHCPLCFLTTACVCPQLFTGRHGDQPILFPSLCHPQ